MTWRSRGAAYRSAALRGAAEGVAELLPISSSAHGILLPDLVGWGFAPEPVLEAVLHGAVAAALLPALRRSAKAVPPAALLPAVTVPAGAGFLLEGVVDRQLRQPAAVAAALLGGGLALALAARQEGVRGSGAALPWDGLLLGLAGTAALAPGVSRLGATLAVARLRRFTPAASYELSWASGGPLLLGAALLRLWRAGRRGRPLVAGELVAGSAAAYLTARLASRLGLDRWAAACPLPFALYRVVLGSLALARGRAKARAQSRSRSWP